MELIEVDQFLIKLLQEWYSFMEEKKYVW